MRKANEACPQKEVKNWRRAELLQIRIGAFQCDWQAHSLWDDSDDLLLTTYKSRTSRSRSRDAGQVVRKQAMDNGRNAESSRSGKVQNFFVD
jgi:hypothetical protein